MSLGHYVIWDLTCWRQESPTRPVRLGWPVDPELTGQPTAQAGAAGGTLTNERNVNVISLLCTAQPGLFSEIWAGRESGADGKMLLLLLPPSEPSRPLHNGKLSGGNLSLALSSLSAPRPNLRPGSGRTNFYSPSLLSCSPAQAALSHHSTARPAFPFNFSF